MLRGRGYRAKVVVCILFGDSEEIAAGSIVRRTLRTAAMPVGEGYLGRIVDATGIPVDGKGMSFLAEAHPFQKCSNAGMNLEFGASIHGSSSRNIIFFSCRDAIIRSSRRWKASNQLLGGFASVDKPCRIKF